MNGPADRSLRQPAGATAGTVRATDALDGAADSALGGDAADSGVDIGTARRTAGFQRVIRALQKYLPPAIVLVLMLGAWQGIIVLFNVPSFIVPSPFAVAQGFVDNSTDLMAAAYYTLRDALAGFALSIVVGALMAMVLAQSKALERGISPYATMLQTIPIIAIAPIINILIGASETGVAIIAFIIAVFPIISNTTLGLTSVDHNLLNLFQMYNASRWQLLWKLRLPNSLPYLLAGVRISSGLAVIGAFVGEVFAGTAGTQGGLGYMILVAGNRMQMDVLFAAALLSAALGIAIFVAVNMVNFWILHNWHESATRREN